MSAPATTSHELPHAVADPEPRWSWIWLIPITAAVVAAALALQAWGHRGVPVAIRFAEGHGLEAGDVVRHRGIVVGEVHSVSLLPDDAGVEVEVRLEPASEDVARVGSRFWIVRPQLRLSGVAGLETLIGSRYLRVLPGRGELQRRFVGLEEPPLEDALDAGGLEIVLEGAHRGSLQRGSPVTYRKIRVGSVLSVGLAPDARTVEVRARIQQPYVQLVRAGTRFWNVSGLSYEVGLTGVRLHLDTLDALIAGGVALATPPDAGEIVSTGHRFTLHSEPASEWLDWRPALAIGHSLLPPGAPSPRPLRAALQWQQGRLWTSSERREGWVLAVSGGLLGPADLLTPPEGAHADSTVLELAGERLPLPEATAVRPHLALLSTDPPVPPWPAERQRVPAEPEDCLVFGGGASPLSLAASRLEPIEVEPDEAQEGGADDADDAAATPEDDRHDDATAAPGENDAAASATARGATWRVDPAVSIDDDWHGAAVVARRDGRLVGLLVIDDDRALVATLPHTVP